MQGDLFIFHVLRTRLRTVKVEPIEGEIVNLRSIINIQVIT
jgi:hypothetical protein